MMRTMIFFIFLTVAQVGAAQDDGLRIGEYAPALDGARLLYGESIERFEPEMLYLVEFTHLDCKPCRVAIPHLTELQDKYEGKLKVVSIYSYYSRDKRDEAGYATDISALKRHMGDRMDYTVALDARDRTVKKRWKHTQGFPKAYLVDGQGKLVWKGMGDFILLDNVVGHAIDGQVDVNDLLRRQKAFDAVYADVIKNEDKRPLHRSLAMADSLIGAFPERQADGLRLKFYTYLRHNRAEANRFLRQAQHRWPEWTFDSAIFNYDHYDGLELSLALENIDREIRGNQDVLMVATLKLKKGRLLIWHGNYADALALLRETEFMRFSYTKISATTMEPSQGWQQVAVFGLASAYGEQAASNWLEYHIGACSLPYFSTTTILNVFEGKLTADQVNMLEIYMKKQIKQRRGIP